MTSDGLITVPLGTTLEEAKEILHRHRIEKLPVVDEDGRLRGLITVKDIQKQIQYPDATVDARGRLRVGAAVGIGDDALERAQQLARAGGDVPVMLGSLLAGVDESPGEIVLRQGERFKEYRGMGSMGAMMDRAYARDRYFQQDMSASKLIAEGVEGQVPYMGGLANLVYQLVGGLQSAMGYMGAPTINDMRDNARFMRVTAAALEENHPHDVIVTKQPPNYWGRRGGMGDF